MERLGVSSLARRCYRDLSGGQQQQRVLLARALCGAKLDSGDVCYRINGLCVCPDCLPAFARDFFRTALEIIL